MTKKRKYATLYPSTHNIIPMAPTESLDRVSTAPSLSAAQAIPGVDLSRLPPERREEVARALRDTTMAGRLGFNDPTFLKNYTELDEATKASILRIIRNDTPPPAKIDASSEITETVAPTETASLLLDAVPNITTKDLALA